MNGMEVGRLVFAAGTLRFSYATTWLDEDRAIPLSVSLPLGSTAYAGERVEAFFDNLLPDSVDIRQRMQERFGTATARTFDLLEAAGRDCVGAVQLLPPGERGDVRRTVAERVSDSDIARTLRDLRRAPLGMLPEHDEFRISLAGAQDKTGFLWYRRHWRRPVGPTPTSHIFKPPIGASTYGLDLRDSVENEWLCMALARQMGVRTANAEIGQFDDTRALVVERFDRRWSKDGSWLIRIPHEDLCQAFGLPGGRKYENEGGPGIVDVLRFLRGSVTPIDDQRQFLRACIVFWLLAAIDGHAKNVSIELRPGGRFALAPFYDVLSAYPMIARGEMDRHRIRMAMAAIGKSKHYRHLEIVRRHWLSTARAGGVPERDTEEILVSLADTVKGAIDAVTAKLPAGFPEPVAAPIFDGLRATAQRLGATR